MSTESIPNQTYQSVSATDDAVIVEDKHEVTDPSSPAKAPELAWKNLNFLLGEKKILSDNWGKVKAGQICAILGPSGAGKSSLLNVLAGRSSSVDNIVIEGQIKVDGQTINPVTFRRNIAYVMQDDALIPTATPREALLFSAIMRLPASHSKEKIRAMVEDLLTELGLQGCSNVMIGGGMMVGISGGQRKRTSIGVELVTQPVLLFLDEPTSGLDSNTAFTIVHLLKTVVKRGCTILCTIHQPSSEIFFLFDSVIFLKDGRVFYQGACKEATSYFLSKGYPCPANHNPADFIMMLCQRMTEEEATVKGLFIPVPEDHLVDNDDDKLSSVRISGEADFKVQHSFTRQVMELTIREAVGTVRNYHGLIARFGITIFIYLLFGLIFMNAGKKDNGNASSLTNHFGGMTECLMGSMSASAQPVLLSFPFERPIFMREYATGTYSALAYFISKVLVEAPLTFSQQLVAYLLGYFMIGLQGKYIYFVLTAWAMGMCASSVAVMCGCLVTHVKQASELVPILFVPQMLFVGFFISINKIPIYMRWAQYLCSLKYAMNLFLINEFDLDHHSCSHSEAARDNCRNILVSNDVETNHYYIYILVLFALFVGFRLVGGLILVQRAKRFY